MDTQGGLQDPLQKTLTIPGWCNHGEPLEKKRPLKVGSTARGLTYQAGSIQARRDWQKWQTQRYRWEVGGGKGTVHKGSGGFSMSGAFWEWLE